MVWKINDAFYRTLNVSESRKKRIRKNVSKFVNDLDDHQIEQITKKDIDDFLLEHSKTKITEFHAEDLKYFFDDINNESLKADIDELKYKYTAPFKIIRFKSVHSDAVEKLESLGIFTNYQLFYYLQEHGMKETLAETTIEKADMNRMIKLSDLTRLFAVKETIAELYLNSGLDSVKAISKMKPDDLIDKVSVYIQQNQLSNAVPKPKEATFVINYAKNVIKNSDLDVDRFIT